MKRSIGFIMLAFVLALGSFLRAQESSAEKTQPQSSTETKSGKKNGGEKKGGKFGAFLRSLVPGISFPALTNITGINAGLNGYGLQIERYNVVFRNGANLNATATVIVYERVVAELKPGQIAVDNRLTQMHQEQIPVMVFYYKGDRPEELLGVSYGRANLYPGMSQSQPLLFERVLAPDGSTISAENDHVEALSAEELGEKIVHMPRKWESGTNGLQVANASRFLVRIGYNGRVCAILRPGSITDRFVYFEKQVVFGWGTDSVQVDYFREEGDKYVFVKSLNDVPLFLSSWGIYGRQLVIGDPSVGYIANY